jgi:hypothetical protein
MSEYDDLMRQMMEQQPYGLPYDSLQRGLMGDGSINIQPSQPQDALASIQAKNQANLQNMQSTAQNDIAQGMQASQGLQAQRQNDMSSTMAQTAQAAAQKQQQQQWLLGTLAKIYLGGGK